MANPIKNAILRAYVEGVLTDLMVRTNVNNITLDDGGAQKTLAAKLTEIISTLNNKASQSDVTNAIATAVDGLINGAPSTYDTLKEIADYIADNEDVVSALNAAIGNKVDKVAGKGLSANDFTNTLLSKLNAIAAGAQANVIETVKVNGAALTPSSKAVDIPVPTGALASKSTVAESDLDASLQAKVNAASEGNHSHSNKAVLDAITGTKTGQWDTAYTHSQAAHAPSGAQVNVLEGIKVNGTTQAISGKVANITMPVIYAQADPPAGLKAGDLFLQILE